MRARLYPLAFLYDLRTCAGGHTSSTLQGQGRVDPAGEKRR
jgi:hypothetical protein